MTINTLFPNGIGTFPSNHAIAPFPTLPTQWQIVKGDDFIPFRQSTDYTATTGGTGATAAAFPWNGGAVKITAGSTSPFKSMEALGANCLAFMPGNGLWHDVRIGVPTGSQTNPVNDANLFVGFFDNVDPSAAANGVYFYKPAGGTAVHFVITKAGSPAPVQSAPSTATTGGTIAANTYFIVVTATTATGETVRSNELSQVTTGSTSTITVNWATATNATGYKVYIGTATGAENLVATVAGGGSTTTTLTALPGTSGTPPAANTSGGPTFLNVGDLSKPSGLFGNPFDVQGVLTANATGTTLTSLAVTTPGFGYRAAPLTIVNGTAGSGAQAYVQLGGSAGFPTLGMSQSNQQSSSLFATYVTAAGSGYTAGTFTVDVIPWINLQFMYTGKGRLVVGINGRVVMALDTIGAVSVINGTATNVATATNPSFNFNTGITLPAGDSVQPPAGDPIVVLPQVPMQLAFGILGTTANNRVMYVEEINIATELN